MLIFILVVVLLVAGIEATNGKKKKADNEQEYRMYKDPEYRAFIEEKRAIEKAESEEYEARAAKVRSILIIIAVVGIVAFVYFMGQ